MKDLAPQESQEIPLSINPEDIFKRIDQIRDSIKEPPPNLLKRMIIPGARELADEITRVKQEAIAARRKLIDALSSSIDLYVDAHKDELKIRSTIFVVTTFSELRTELFRANESSIISFFETYGSLVDRINALDDLTEQEKRDLIESAYKRAQEETAGSERTYLSILDLISEQVRSMVSESSSSSSFEK